MSVSDESVAPSPEEMLSLHRYFIWADLHCRRFFDLAPRLAAEGDEERRFDVRFRTTAELSYWYGALYVVVEGWRELGLADEEIDGCLAEAANVRLLHRYRNATFHFQRQYHDDKFMDVISAGQGVVKWVQRLQAAFDRYFVENMPTRGQSDAAAQQSRSATRKYQPGAEDSM